MFVVRDYQEKDQEKVWEIIQEGWKDSVFWEIKEEILLENCKRSSYPALINDSYKKLILVQTNQNSEQIAGYLCLEPKSDRIYYIADFYIKKEYRRMGAGKKLFEAGLDCLKQKKVREVYLYLDDTNQRAANFYQKSGFVPFKKSEFDWYDKNGKKVASNPEHLLKLEI